MKEGRKEVGRKECEKSAQGNRGKRKGCIGEKMNKELYEMKRDEGDKEVCVSERGEREKGMIGREGMREIV